MRLPLSLVALFFCVSCSSQKGPPAHNAFDPFIYQVDTSGLLSGAAFALDAGKDLVAAERDPMAISPEIRRYIDQLPGQASPEEKWSLLVQQFRDGLFEVEFDTFATLPVAETFLRRKGNCLSVTMLLAAMAREIGVKASFNQVEVPPKQIREREVAVNFRHINLLVELPEGRQVIDFGVVDFDIAFASATVPDRVALSQYYNNNAVADLVSGEWARAFLRLRKAVELAPGNSDFWVNLGVLYEKVGEYDLATDAFIQALQLNRLNLVAARNLERVANDAGHGGLIGGLVTSVERLRNDDPGLVYFEARDAYEEGKYAEAKRLLKRVVNKAADDHRLHFLMGITSYRLQDFGESTRHLREAFALVRDRQIKKGYRRQLFELKQSANL